MPPKKKSTKKSEEDGGEDKATEVEEEVKADEATEEPPTKAPKLEEPAKEEPKAEAKKEETKEETKKEEPAKPKEPEKPKEQEEDAAHDSRAKVKAGSVCVNQDDATLNVLQVKGSSMLRSLSEGGMQYLLAGARATAGVKSGRYMFEVKIVESLAMAEPQAPGGRTPQPKQLLRIGFSLKGGSLFGDGDDSVTFDSEGFSRIGNQKKKAGNRFNKDTIAVLVNLDAGSPNANTVSLFRNGKRDCEPQALPEGLVGKALFPTVTYRNVAVDVNFCNDPRSALPFKCRMLGDAATDDVEVNKPSSPSDGKYTVLYPVGLPDKGYFAWIDQFLAKHPEYVEISDRKIIDWAKKSGMWMNHVGGSNDKPVMNYGIQLMDDGSVSKVINAIAPALRRHYVVAEVKNNLLAENRKPALADFYKPHFRKEAVVLMGEPTAEFKENVHAGILADKKKKALQEKKKKAQEKERNRLLEEKKKKAEEARKARLLPKGDAAAAEEAKKEEPDAAVDDEEADEPVELTEEEKKVCFPKTQLPDLSEKVFAKAYSSFTLPTAAEGFANVRFEWEQESACTDLLRKYILDQKLSQKAEDLVPGEWFKEQVASWQKLIVEWKKRQIEHKDPNKRKQYLAKKAEEAKKANDGEEVKPVEIDMEELDVSGVDDINDVGNGEPLFFNFVSEDWQLLSLRYEVFLLLHAFKKDLNDPDRPSFTEAHFPFYYQKYFKRQFVPSSYGSKTVAEFLQLIKEVAKVADSGLLEGFLADDTSTTNFVKATEEHRRDRMRRFDAGDETAQLKFRALQAPAPTQSRPGFPQAARPQLGGARPQLGGAPRPSMPSYRPQAPAQPPGKRLYPGPSTAYAPVWKQPRLG